MARRRFEGSRGATPPELSPRHRNDETYQDIQSSALDSEAFYENLPYLRPTGGSPSGLTNLISAFHNKKDVPEGVYTSVCSEEEYFSVSDQQRSQQYTPHANPRLTEPRGRHGTLPSTAITWSNDQPAGDEDLYERLPNSSSESEMFSQGHGSVNNTNGVYTIPTKAQGGSYATVPMQMEFEGYRDDFSSADQQRGHQHTPYANPKLTSNEPRERRLPSPPRTQWNDRPAQRILNSSFQSERSFENVSLRSRPSGGSSFELNNDTNINQNQNNGMYVTSCEVQGSFHASGRRTGYQNDFSSDDEQHRDYDASTLTSKELFERSPHEYLNRFESTRDEERTNEVTFIIVDLLKKSESNSPILDGNLDQLALLACCSSPHVVKRALDALLNEIFLAISDFSGNRCRNILAAENTIRQTFHKFLSVENLNAKCQRMTTYAWLITFVLLKCSKQECTEIETEMRRFDRTLDGLLRENNERNTFRYGIVLAKESIKRIVLLCGRKDAKNSIGRSIEKCANILNGKMEETEVTKFARALDDEDSWLNLHLCLVFLQDLSKLHQFQGNLRPIFLIQMLIKDHRERSSSSSKFKITLKAKPESWKFEILVYHVMRRLIRTSKSDEITEQILMGKQGCGGVFNSWSEWSEQKLKTKKDSLVMQNLEKLCERVVFRAPRIYFGRLIASNCKGNVQDFIEALSILRLTSMYKDRVLEILPKADIRWERNPVSTYDALMNGKPCLLKVYRHSKDEVMKANTPSTTPLRKEIEIVKVLNALAEPCPNLLQLLGSSVEAPMHMIIERGSKGDLLAHLKYLNNPETQCLIQIALDICNAMMFLDSHDIIHRDLRAKNCFVFMENGNLLAKLGGFQLAAIVYAGPRSPTAPKPRSVITTMDKDFPSPFSVPWMAVETLQYGEFSSASDVWSYGVLLFEIFTLGCQPYVNMPSGLSLNSDKDVREYVTNGKRLELYPRIPDSIQDLIQLTMVDADHRPTFRDLRDALVGMKFEDELYAAPACFKVSYVYENVPAVTNSRPANSRTGCAANGCFGECVNASDIAVASREENRHLIKEFIPASLRDVLRLFELEYCSLAVLVDKIFHEEKLELITEIGDMGNLTEFISDYGCSIENALRYLSQIAEAVSFLHNRRFIHRNLRANSVFVYSNGDAKLACFARVRKLAPKANDQSSTIPIHLPMPDDSLRWSSPEVMVDGEYSKASDIWAFGVLIWEMFALIDKERDESDGEIIPYQQLASKEQILSYIQRDERLGQPKNCPDWLYEMMLRCWQQSTQERAKSQDIVECINE